MYHSEDFEQSLKILELRKKFIEDIFNKNKDFFDKNPSKKNNTTNDLVFIENSIILTKEKLGFPPNEITNG